MAATIGVIPEQEDDGFIQEKNSELRLEQSIPDDALKKKGKLPPSSKKTKGKQKQKVKTKKQTAETISTDTTLSLFSGDFASEITEDVTSKKEKIQTMLHLEEEEEIDWESDLDVDVIINQQVTKDAYLTACEALHVVPVSTISKNLNSKELLLPYHGIGPSGARALGKVLESNITIEKLNLANNGIESGGIFFGMSLCQNHTITYLDLANNNLSFSD
jgi:hypothetical protein